MLGNVPFLPNTDIYFFLWYELFLCTATSALIGVFEGRSGAVPEGTHFTVAPEKHTCINLSRNQDVQFGKKKLETVEEKEDIVLKWGEILFAAQ